MAFGINQLPQDGCPHARGGGPLSIRGLRDSQAVVPMLVGVVRTDSLRQSHHHAVVPMLVGVVRAFRAPSYSRASVVPMLVGVVRVEFIYEKASVRLSPCSWGWSGSTGH